MEIFVLSILNNAPRFYKMCIARSSRMENLYWMFPLANAGGNMETRMAGRRWKADFGNQVRTWYWRKASIIQNSPFGLINTLSSKRMGKYPFIETGFRITLLKPSPQS